MGDTEVITTALPANSGLVIGAELDAMLGNAKLLLASGLLPKRFNNPESVVVAAIYGKGLGMDFMTAASEVYIVNGSPSCSSKIMLGVVKHREPKCQIKILEQSDTLCHMSIKRLHDDDYQDFKYTIEDAQKAGLLSKTPWKNHPTDMLTARCFTRMFRATCMDLLGGFGHTPDELEDSTRPVFDVSKVKKKGIPKGQVVEVEVEEVKEEKPVKVAAIKTLTNELKATDKIALVEMISDSFREKHGDSPETLVVGYEIFQERLKELNGGDND